MKQDFYRLDRILQTGAIWNVLLGERANGKSYAVKEYAINQALSEKNITCALIRRLDEDIKASVICDYFNDTGLINMLKKKSEGKYNCITYYQRKFYFSYYDEEKDKVTKGFPFCVVFALANAERYKSSTVFPTLKTVIFEEFTTEKFYLTNEVNKLMNLCSTLFRLNTGKVFMIANKISRVCPYFVEFGFQKGVPKMKEGQLDTYTFKTIEGNDVKISVEMCASPKHAKSGMFFGKNAKVINGSEWETHEHPHLYGNLSDYDTLYKLSLEHMEFSFNILLLSHKTEDFLCVYVYPATLKTFDRLLTEQYSIKQSVTPTLDSRIKAEVLIQDLVERNKLVYPDNQIGEDFTSVLNNMKQSPFNLV